MRPIARIFVAVLALMLCVSPLAAADQEKGGHNDRPKIVPVTRIHGNTGGELVRDWYAQNLALPADRAPFTGKADLCLNLGRHGRVLSPAGGIVNDDNNIVMRCTVEVGRPVLLVATSADCSSAEADPFRGITERQQRKCVLNVLNNLIDVTSIAVSIDGAKPVDIHRSKFFAVSPQGRVVFPPNPVFEATPGPATFVAAAWIAEIRGMRPGHHVLVEAPTIVGQSVPPFTVHFNVVDNRHHDS
jgi:hypothetical protein